MHYQRPSYRWIIRQLICLCALGMPLRAQAGVVFDVSVDTSSIQSVIGSVDFQYNPGDATTLASTASVSHFVTDGTGLSVNVIDGDVSGGLIPGPLAISNTLALNDLLENITFGSHLSFTLTMTGPGVTSPESALPGSSFALTFYDNSFNPLLTTDAAGTVVTLNLNPDGTTNAYTFPSDNVGGASAASVSQVPEPTSGLLVGSGLALVAIQFLVRRRNTKKA